MIQREGEHGEFLPEGVRSVRTVKPDHGKRFCFLASTPGSPASSFSPKACPSEARKEVTS